MNYQFLNCKRLAHGTLLVAIVSVTGPEAYAASFDCAKARSKSERLTCGDPQLSVLDDRLAALARDGKKRASNPRAYQRALDAAWLVRQKCEDVACVESWYARRIAVLSNNPDELDTSAERRPPAKQLPAPEPTLARPGTGPQTPVPLPRASANPAAAPPAPPAPPAQRVEAAPATVAAPTERAPQPAAPAARATTPVAEPAPAVGQRTPPPPPSSAPAPRRAVAAPVINGPAKPNVSPGAQLQVIGQELGFNVPLTREEFLDRYNASGGQCGVSGALSSLQALSRSVQSDCWTGTECPAPAAGVRCQILRTAYDSTGRILLFTTKLSATDANGTEGARALERTVGKFADLGNSEVRTRDVNNGRVISSAGSQGQFRLEAEVKPVEGGGKSGTFTVATK